MKENLISHSLYLNVFTILRHYPLHYIKTSANIQLELGLFCPSEDLDNVLLSSHLWCISSHFAKLSALQRHIILGWGYRGMLSRSRFPSIHKLCLSGTV